MKKIDEVLNSVLNKIKPEEADIKLIEVELKKFLEFFNKKIKSTKIKTEVFIGGSFAKKSVMRKDDYDVDIFVRFDKQYKEEELSDLTKRLLGNLKGIEVIHGSRDYFRLKINDKIYFEIVPVIKVKKPSEARNITDLSYSHVKYITKNVKNQRIRDEIILAKAFCYSNGTYGAESYIKGFSGYSLELLIYYYKSLENFLKEVVKSKERIIVDMEKQYRNKKRILLDLNGSKLESPIILIDPTFKQRNALAALSKETFEKFKTDAKLFLENPSEKFFQTQNIDLEKLKKNAKLKKLEFIELKIFTKKQQGDIAGSKLLKFYNHLTFEISKYFEIDNKGFLYDKKQSANVFFIAKKKKERLIEGPFIEDKENCKQFRKEHSGVIEKKGKLYFREKINFGLKEFLKKWKNRNSNKIKEMYIQEIRIN
jgi:tRNA nucleotidyltransferase (CCA-adding enzyme)